MGGKKKSKVKFVDILINGSLWASSGQGEHEGIGSEEAKADWSSEIINCRANGGFTDVGDLSDKKWDAWGQDTGYQLSQQKHEWNECG